MHLMSDVDWRLSVERPPAGDHGGSDRDRTESDDLRQNQGSHSLRWSVHTAVLPKLNVAVAADLEQTAQAHGLMLEAAESGVSRLSASQSPPTMNRSCAPSNRND